MSSGFLAGQQGELRSGGKILRGRRLLPPFSPYSRPSSSTAPSPLRTPESQSKTRHSWILGVISGAGKLISSVLGSDGCSSSPSDCSSDYASGEDYDSNPDEHEDYLSEDLTGYRMRVDRNVESLDIVPKSAAKLLIQELLMQETFTRDECNKMMEIIQSRVVDIPYLDIDEGIENEALERVNTKDPLQHLDQTRNFARASNISAFSTRHYSHEAVFSDLHNKAVMEAKKWFEEKKLSPVPIHEQEFEPCILNSKDYSSDGSPIEVAKSYMQSLPPWRSPSFSNDGFKNKTPIGKHSFYAMGGNLLPTSKGDKGNDFAVGSLDSEKCRTYLKSAIGEPEGSQSCCLESPTRISVLEASKLSPETEQNGNIVEESPHKLHDAKATDVGHQMETDDLISEKEILQPEEGVEKSVQTKGQGCIISASQSSLTLASVAGDYLLETGITQAEIIAPTDTSTQENSGDKMRLGDNNFLHVNVDPDLEPSDMDLCIREDANGSAEHIGTNGHLPEVKSMNSEEVSTSKGDPSTSNGGAAVESISGDIPSARGNIGRASNSQNGAKTSCSREPGGPRRGKRRVKKVVRQKKWKG